MKHLKIGHVAKAVNLTVEGIRFYEKMGLIPEVKRARSGHRIYSQDTVGRIQFIQQMQNLGFQLEEISEVLKRLDTDWSEKTVLSSLLSQQISSLEKNWKKLTEARQLLTGVNGGQVALRSSSDFFRAYRQLQKTSET